MKQVICIGSSSKDVFLPTSGGVVTNTPKDLTSQKKLSFELGAKFQIDNIYEAPGGCCANVSQGLARLNIETSCYSKLGDDSIGKWIISELKKEGVGTSLIQVDSKCKSDLSHIVVDESSKDHIIFFNRDANDKLEVFPEDIRDTEWIFLSALNGNWVDYVEDIMGVVEDNLIHLAFNPGQRNINSNPDVVIRMIENAEVLIVNKDEAIEIVMWLLNQKGDEDMQEELNDETFLINELQGIRFGKTTIAVTDGERGAWVSDGESILHAKSIQKEIVDTLGAGDAFTSGFLASCVEGLDLESCLKRGLVNGKNVTRFYGAKAGLLSADDMSKEIVKVKTNKLI
ncbi:carbohydrate kinase family protein [Patescibacteria group bacterium]